jgi:hypothetical protein
MRPILAMLLFLAAAPCHAQSDTVAPAPRHLCWRGKPSPECSSFWITEFGVDDMLASTQRVIAQNFGGGDVYRYEARDFDSRFVWMIGPMFNRGSRQAIGGTLSISPLGGRYRAAVEARRRWWAAEGLGLDLSAGALRMGVPNATGTANRTAYGVTAGAFVVGADLININGRADVLFAGGKARFGTSVGVGGGSYAAVVGSLILGALVLAIISAGPLD